MKIDFVAGSWSFACSTGSGYRIYCIQNLQFYIQRDNNRSEDINEINSSNYMDLKAITD